GECARSRRGRGRTAPRSRPAGPRRTRSCAALGIPTAASTVVEDDRVLAALEHDLEVAAHDGVLGPPAVDDAPFLAHERDGAVVHLERPCVRVGLDARSPGRVEACGYSSFGTSRAR